MKLKDINLHIKLMLTLVIFITLTISVVSYILIKNERETHFRELEERADRLVDLASHSLAYSVWNVDLKAIDEFTNSLLTYPEVVQCTVTAVGYGTILEVNSSMNSLSNPIVRKKNIDFINEETGHQKIGSIQIVLTRAVVEQYIVTTQRNFIGLILLILIVIYFATFIFIRRIVSEPIARLEKIVERISKGDLEVRCSVESNDEIGKLAMSFNSMANSLGRSDRKLRESARRLELVLEGSQLGYWDWNIETGEVIRNSRWGEMLGYTVEEVQLSVKQWSDLQHPDDRELAWQSIVDHLEGRTDAHKIEYRMLTKDGNYKWILDQAKIVCWNKDGKPSRMCGTHIDITERRIAEQENERVQTQLAQSQKMESLGKLTGGIAHDFNNMLNGIINASQLLLNPKRHLDEHGLKIVDIILQASFKAADLIKKLLSFSRKSEINFIPVDIHEIIEDSINILTPSIDNKINISIVKRAQKSYILADHSTLENIIINLVINASHAMDNGGKIEIITENVYIDQTYCLNSSFDIESGNYCKIKVTDSGAGIPVENYQKIFEPFFTTKEEGQGTGLGLSAVYGSIQNLNGEIIVESEVGVGTSFHIIIPCVEEFVKVDSPDKQEFNNPILMTKTILLVDDSEINRFVGKEIMESLGYNILLAENGQKALDIYSIKHNEIDLVILDMTMPVMNGDKAFIKMKNIDKDCKVIISSGNINVETIIELKKIGLLGTLKKPFTISELNKKLDEVLNK